MRLNFEYFVDFGLSYFGYFGYFGYLEFFEFFEFRLFGVRVF